MFTTTRRVEFRETDAAGIAHFTTFFGYMEEAEHAMLRHLGTSVVIHEGTDTLSWPRVAAQCDYRGSVRFEDVVEIQLQVARMGNASVTYQMTFRLRDQVVAEGSLTSVHCRFRPGEPPRSEPIPNELRKQLSAYLA